MSDDTHDADYCTLCGRLLDTSDAAYCAECQALIDAWDQEHLDGSHRH